MNFFLNIKSILIHGKIDFFFCEKQTSNTTDSLEKHGLFFFPFFSLFSLKKNHFSSHSNFAVPCCNNSNPLPWSWSLTMVSVYYLIKISSISLQAETTSRIQCMLSLFSPLFSRPCSFLFLFFSFFTYFT